MKYLLKFPFYFGLPNELNLNSKSLNLQVLFLHDCILSGISPSKDLNLSFVCLNLFMSSLLSCEIEFNNSL